MAEHMMLIDLTKCTGCRACQVACKEWNGLRAEKTKFNGSYQNPPDLSYDTWTLVRFDEMKSENSLKKVKWLMRKEGCMHCVDAPCVKACPSPGALVKTPEGAVVHNPKYCIGCKACVVACPFDIPRYSPQEEKIAKCTLCYDRITEGKVPACVEACTTGCLEFGPKEDIIARAKARIKEVDASLYPNNGYETHVIYIVPKYAKLEEFSHLNPDPKVPTTELWWKNLFKPLTLIGMGGVAGLAALHYLIKGPHRVEDKGTEGGDDNG